MPRLVAMLTNKGMPLPGIRPLAMATLEIGQGQYREWGVHVRGPAVFLVSPPGWASGSTVRTGEARTVYEIPRGEVYLRWELDAGDDMDKLARWSPPERPKVPVAIDAPQSDAHDAIHVDAPEGLYRSGTDPNVGEVVGLAEFVPAAVPTVTAEEPERSDEDDPDDLPVTVPKSRQRRT